MTHVEEIMYGMAFQIWAEAIRRLFRRDRFNFFIVDNDIRAPGRGERLEEIIPEDIPTVILEAARDLYDQYEESWGRAPTEYVYSVERSIGRTLPLIEVGRDLAMHALSEEEGYGYRAGEFVGISFPTSPRVVMSISFDGRSFEYSIKTKIPKTANPAGLTARGERMYGHIRDSYGDDPRSSEIAARTVISRSHDIPGLMKNPPRLREGEREFSAVAGETVDFGRPKGERTRGKVLGVADKTVLVESLEDRGKVRRHAPGRRYRVPRTDWFLKRPGAISSPMPTPPSPPKAAAPTVPTALPRARAVARSSRRKAGR